MKVTKYRRELEFSYSLGAFPTIELINNHPNDVIAIYIHSSFNNENVISLIKEKITSLKIFHDDKVFDKLNEKGNTYIIGIFKKYKNELEKNVDHVILDNISNMGNLGTIIRSSLGFGIKNIALIGNNIDYLDPKVIRASMGAIFKMNIVRFETLEDYLKNHKNHIYPFMLKSKFSLDSVEFAKEPSSLVFGNESSGLDETIYSKFDSIVIKHTNDIDSLNITNATSIALYEFYKQRRA